MGRGTSLALAAGLAAGLALAGCVNPRGRYDRVRLGMGPAEVREILGAPRYEFVDEWVYTRDDPRDLERIAVYFARDDGRSVVGKRWRSPRRPDLNHQEGRVPPGPE